MVADGPSRKEEQLGPPAMARGHPKFPTTIPYKIELVEGLYFCRGLEAGTRPRSGNLAPAVGRGERTRIPRPSPRAPTPGAAGEVPVYGGDGMGKWIKPHPAAQNHGLQMRGKDGPRPRVAGRVLWPSPPAFPRPHFGTGYGGRVYERSFNLNSRRTAALLAPSAAPSARSMSSTTTPSSITAHAAPSQ